MTANNPFEALILQIHTELRTTRELVYNMAAALDSMEGKTFDPEAAFINFANDFWMMAHYVMGADFVIRQSEVDMFNLIFKNENIYTTIERAQEKRMEAKKEFEANYRIPRSLHYLVKYFKYAYGMGALTSNDCSSSFDRMINLYGLILSLIVKADTKAHKVEIDAVYLILENCESYIRQETNFNYKISKSVMNMISAALA